VPWGDTISLRCCPRIRQTSPARGAVWTGHAGHHALWSLPLRVRRCRGHWESGFARVAEVFVAQLEGGRDIDIADASPEALDISEATLAKTIIEQEQERSPSRRCERLTHNIIWPQLSSRPLSQQRRTRWEARSPNAKRWQ
jgi:hypothetical protein